ncbi:MAG: hypothetical protein C4324_01560 [Blastocatellia bacterium]
MIRCKKVARTAAETKANAAAAKNVAAFKGSIASAEAASFIRINSQSAVKASRQTIATATSFFIPAS